VPEPEPAPPGSVQAPCEPEHKQKVQVCTRFDVEKWYILFKKIFFSNTFSSDISKKGNTCTNNSFSTASNPPLLSLET
jgi:hypothetical protein